MQAGQAAEMRRDRQARGLDVCARPSSQYTLDKEYELGAQTGDYVCTHCGAVFSPAEMAEFRSRQ